MIKIRSSPTADNTTCDYTTVTKEQLLASSAQHIEDVGRGLVYFAAKLMDAAAVHDKDKITEIDWFHSNFITNFQKDDWWQNHKVINRHHLNCELGVPREVNLIDVIEYITDCVMAGMARSGDVYEIVMTPELLLRAFKNTVELLKGQVVVDDKGEE